MRLPVPDRFKVVFRAQRVEIIDFGFLIVLVELVHFNVPWSLILVGPHIGEAQRTRITIVKVRPGFCALIGTA